MKLTVEVPDLLRLPLLSRAQVETLLVFPVILQNCLAAGWIAPIARSGNKAQGNEIYSRQSVDGVISRIQSGEMPPAVIRKKEGAL